MPDEIDEDELLGELDALELDMADEKESGSAVPSYLVDEPESALPSAPTATPEAPQKEEAQPSPAIAVDEYGLPMAQKT